MYRGDPIARTRGMRRRRAMAVGWVYTLGRMERSVCIVKTIEGYFFIDPAFPGRSRAIRAVDWIRAWIRSWVCTRGYKKCVVCGMGKGSRFVYVGTVCRTDGLVGGRSVGRSVGRSAATGAVGRTRARWDGTGRDGARIDSTSRARGATWVETVTGGDGWVGDSRRRSSIGRTRASRR